METEIVEVRLPMLEKPYKYTGEYRRVTEGDRFMNEGMVQKWCLQHYSEESYPIVEREPWVPELDEMFYILDVRGEVKEVEYRLHYTKECVAYGNYFKTAELAEAARVKMISLLKECDHDQE